MEVTKTLPPDRQLVLDLCQLSIDVHKVKESDNKLDIILSNTDYTLCMWINARLSTEAMVVTEVSSSTVIVVFAGSLELDDWQTNSKSSLDIAKFDGAPNDVRVHRGYQHALFSQGITSIIENKVLDLVGKKGKVILTGHSLGAANAHIMAVYLADRNPYLSVAMINFGSPRVGNRVFKEWTEKKLINLSAWRYVFRKDFVPRLPPRIHGYQHAGHLVMINRFHSVIYYNQNGDGKMNYDGAPKDWYKGYSIFNHSLVHQYLHHFKTNINKSSRFWPIKFKKKHWYKGSGKDDHQIWS